MCFGTAKEKYVVKRHMWKSFFYTGNKGDKKVRKDQEALFMHLKAEDWTCHLCNKEIGGSRSHCIDHNHQTGRIRGVLCKACNRAEYLHKAGIKTDSRFLDFYREAPKRMRKLQKELAA